ncbi:Nudix hydrolase [Quillaja saponaria]|uniref:Nudix hydrolase n=1 Tax=Quillaja saponaria TaxID=32244 RepID=A0AAD7Q7J4_QUISA|nr:Nudix hydrolase [Quillaja saponaria]
MSCLLARTGRHRQRYDENNFRLVSGCIPYRFREDTKDDMSDTEKIIEVLMVSSPNRDDLVFPKGGWEDDETVLEAARREALEEAGVRGILREVPLGRWDFRSKSSQDVCSLQGGCRGYMFALEVTEELEIWPEQGNRNRKWLNIQDAFRLCRYEWMRMALEEFLKVMTEDGKLKMQVEIIVPNSIPVSDVVGDCQIMSSSCCVKPSATQHRVGLCNESMVHRNSFQFEKEQTVK